MWILSPLFREVMKMSETVYDWILGVPVQSDTNYEWILGEPYIIYEYAIETGVVPTLTLLGVGR